MKSQLIRVLLIATSLSDEANQYCGISVVSLRYHPTTALVLFALCNQILCIICIMDKH